MFTGFGWPRSSRRETFSPRTGWFVATAILAFLLVPVDAAAQRARGKFKDKIHVVQPKPVLQKGRFELATRFAGSVNDSVYQSVKVGASGNFHVTEALYVGAMVDWFDFGGALGGPTSAYSDAQNRAGALVDAAAVNYTAGLEVGFVPFWGKFSLMNRAVVFYDFALTAGGMWVDSASIANPASSGKPGGTVSLTGHLFFSPWMALNLEVRDVMFSQDLDGAPGAFTNIVTVGGGLSFYLPTTFEYSERVLEVQQ